MTEHEKLREEICAGATGTVKELAARKSVRVFEEREIPADVKRAILFSAAEAPTAGNQQLYTVIDVTDEEKKQRLSVLCDNQPFIAKAPLVLVFCADCKKWYDAYALAGCEPRRPGVGDLMLAVTDTAIAAQNAVCAAHSYGVGSCYIGDMLERCEEMRETLSLPDFVVPSVMLVFGYPTEGQKARRKPDRARLTDTVFENSYPTLDEDAVREAFAYRTDGDFDSYMERFCSRKYNSDFSREMTRSVAEYLKQFEDCLKAK